jgi:O-antigen/teichoic acid export membrane protein
MTSDPKAPEEHPPDPSSEGSISRPAIRGSIWTMGGIAASQLIRLVSNLILTRLLFPAVFGQMSLVFIFIQGLQMFSDVGIGPAIVQNPRGEHPRFLNTAWTIQAGRGFLLWIGSWIIAWPVASFYEQPILRWLIPAAGLTAVLAGFEPTSMHTMRRRLQLGRITLVDLGSQVVGTIATVALAAVFRWAVGPDDPRAGWAMVGGTLVGGVARLALAYSILPSLRHRFELERDALGVLFGFGRWIFVSTLLTFLAGQADRLVFGKMIPMAMFGVYGMFSRARLPLSLGGAAVVTGLIACGPFLVRVMYDARYAEAGWILQFLAAGTLIQSLECTLGAALLAEGETAWVAASNGAKLLGVLALMPLGFHLWGFPGALVALALSDVLKYLTSAIGLARRGMRGYAGDALITVVTAVVSAAGLGVGLAVASRFPGKLPGLAASALVAGSFWLAVGVWYLRRERAAGTPAPWVRPAAS